MKLQVVFLGAALILSASVPAQLQQSGRLRLIPIVSDQRLEDIQESPDHTRLLTHDRGYAPRLWEPKSMRLLGVLPHKFSAVTQAILSSSGLLIGTISVDEARIWDAKSARVLNSFDGFESKSEGFAKIAIASDDKTIAIAGQKGTIWIAKAPLFKLEKLTVLPLNSVIKDLQFSPNGQFIGASAVENKNILTYDLTNQKQTMLTGPEEGTAWIEFSPDNTQLLATSLDNQAHLFSLSDATETKAFEHIIGDKGTAPQTLMAALFVGQDLSEFLVCGPTGIMTIYDRKTLVEKRKLTGYTHAIREIRKSPDGLKIATYEDNYDEDTYDPLKIYDVVTTKEYPFNRAGGPTAAAFNAEGTVFWVGYENGNIVQHRLSDGEWTTSTISSVRPIHQFRVIPQTGRVVVAPADNPFNFFSFDARKVHIDEIYSAGDFNLESSENGKYVLSPAYLTDEESGQKTYQGCWELSTKKNRILLNDRMNSTVWAPGNIVVASGLKYIATFDPTIDEDTSNDKIDSYIKTYMDLDDQEFEIRWVRMSDDGAYIVACLRSTDENNIDNFIQLIDLKTGDYKETVVTKEFADVDDFTVMNDKNFVLFTNNNVYSYDLSTGKLAWQKTYENDVQHDFKYTSNGTELIHITNIAVEKLNPTTGEQTANLKLGEAGKGFYLETYFESESDLLAIQLGRQIAFINSKDLKPYRTITRPDTIADTQFLAKQNRILITDATEQTTIWDMKAVLTDEDSGQLEPLGSFILMQGTPDKPDSSRDSWLVMDREGRFDAPDPNKVTGASYVLEWDGGLEPVDVSQLKSLFYEPGLFGKLLGFDPEPPRSVPNRKSIRLFPEVQIEKNSKNPNRLNISLTDRDEGGIGKTEIYLNSKLIDTRDKTGLISLNLEEFKPYFLPKAQLPEGKGNILSVVSSNQRGDLKSMPVSIDVGVPENLAVPQVNVYGLFVGIGDYVGSKKDLSAPPMDAKKLAEAIGESSERLLPKHVHITTITTDDKAHLPNRQVILDWFSDVATKATSSDIIMVFFAGHGTSQIGSQTGYFFLTAGADPGEVTPSILGVHTISSEDLKVALAKIPASKQVIILDTCHSGAAASDIVSDRASGSDYIRAYESIRDSSGTWLLAGAAADQLSYESRTVDHGLLTYSLLEALDRVSPEGLRATPSGELFLDVERWFNYAATRVESLRNETGIDGIQKPEVRKGATNQTFDLGVTREQFRGEIGLKPPKPIVLMGTFDQDGEDKLGLETAVSNALNDEPAYKLWLNVAKHPKAFRIAGQYINDNGKVTLRLFIQKLDANQNRTNLKTIVIEGVEQDVPGLVQKIREAINKELPALTIGSPTSSSSSISQVFQKR